MRFFLFTEKNNKYKAFTLIELLLVMALTATILGITAPLGANYIARNNVSVAREQIVSTLRSAQNNAINMNSDSTWGVYTSGNTTTLYKGLDYNARDTAFDLQDKLPNGTIVTNGLDINFSKLSGNANLATTIVISNSQSSSLTIQIDTEGVITY